MVEKKMKQLLYILTFFLCATIAHAQSHPLPQLQVAPDKKHFQTSDGKPFFWLGDTGWFLFIKLNREESLRYLDTRQQQGYNVIQVMVLHDLKHAVNRYGDSAITNNNAATPITTPGNDPSKPDEYDFWDHADFVIDAAAERGLYMALVPVWGTNVKNGWVSREQAKTYASFLANRYKNKSNIIWLNGGDIPGSDSLQTWKIIGETINAIDNNHLITFHPRGRTTSSRWFHNEPWLDFNMFQSGHRNYAQDTSKGETHYGEDNWKYIEEDFARKPLKPTLDGEPSYEGIPQGLHDTTQPYWNDDDLRRYAYWSVFSGAAGFTYGHNAVMQFYRSDDKGRAYGAKKYWEEAMTDSGALQMKHLKELMMNFSFEREPDQSLIINNGQRYDRAVAIRGKEYAFIYTYTGNKLKIDAKKLNVKEIYAMWFNPRTAAFSELGKFVTNALPEFDPPGEPAPGNDWVLILSVQ
jgi:Protein of unknown function (DUF4038)/Putative collagen-binding domain of a collagenase